MSVLVSLTWPLRNSSFQGWTRTSSWAACSALAAQDSVEGPLVGMAKQKQKGLVKVRASRLSSMLLGTA